MWGYVSSECCYKTDLSSPSDHDVGLCVLSVLQNWLPSDHDVGHNVLGVLQNWPPSDHDKGLSVTKLTSRPLWPWYEAQWPQCVTKLTSRHLLTMMWGTMSSECYKTDLPLTMTWGSVLQNWPFAPSDHDMGLNVFRVWLTDGLQPVSVCVQTRLLRQARGLSKHHCNVNRQARARAVFENNDLVWAIRLKHERLVLLHRKYQESAMQR